MSVTPMTGENMSAERFVVDRLGHRGEGVAEAEGGPVYIPYALPGETVLAQRGGGDNARLVEVLTPAPDRIAPICPHFGVCGGCAVQTLAPAAYAEWKRGLVIAALRSAGLDLAVAPLVDAHGAGRRRVTFHAHMERGQAHVGFMQARSHDIVEIGACPLLAPELSTALPAARALAQTLAPRNKPLDIVACCTAEGLDVDFRGAGPLDPHEVSALMKLAERFDLARLSNHGRLLVLRRRPRLAVGGVDVALPPGAFLQATQAGEEAIAARVMSATKGAKRIADLFCGFGAFALRLAARARVCAYDLDEPAVSALRDSARKAEGLRLEEAQARDLFRRPLGADELAAFDAVVFDPPRAGAEAQARELARSNVRQVVAISCNATTFARDAKLLLHGGFEPAGGGVTPIDQFRFSPHVELVALFERKARAGAKRSILSR